MTEADRRIRRRVDRLLFGTATLASAESPTRLLDSYVAAGGRRIDLANVYDDGESSRLVGRWLSRTSSGSSPELYVKGCHPPLCAPGFVRREVDRARTLLSVDRLDYFMLHRDVAEIPVAAWADALLSELDRGAVRNVGVSNWSLRRFRALRVELASSARDLAVLSNHVSLAEMISPLVPGCLSTGRAEAQRLVGEGVQVVAWSPLAGGFFAGRPHASWNTPLNRERRRRATTLGAARGISSAAVALAYVLAGTQPLMAAIGTGVPGHLEELMNAAAIELEPDEIAWLENGGSVLPTVLREGRR